MKTYSLVFLLSIFGTLSSCATTSRNEVKDRGPATNLDSKIIYQKGDDVIEEFFDGSVTCYTFSGKRYDAIGGVSCKGNTNNLGNKSEFKLTHGSVYRIISEQSKTSCYVFAAKRHDAVGGMSCL